MEAQCGSPRLEVEVETILLSYPLNRLDRALAVLESSPREDEVYIERSRSVRE